MRVLYVMAGILAGGLIMTQPQLSSAEPFIFPNDGQSSEQQNKDKGYCQTWAKQESGVDPAYVQGQKDTLAHQQANEGSHSRRSGGLVKGAARGAALGAVGSNVDNNVGKRAAQGAMVSGMHRRDQKNAQEAQAQEQQKHQQAANLDAQINNYNRAFAVCMEAKGYSVK